MKADSLDVEVKAAVRIPTAAGHSYFILYFYDTKRLFVNICISFQIIKFE